MAELNPVPDVSEREPNAPPDSYLRNQLLDRRRRLTAQTGAASQEVRALLRDVDAALERLEAASYGLCEAFDAGGELVRRRADRRRPSGTLSQHDAGGPSGPTRRSRIVPR